jgi:LuxR family transcriptional regulator, quorum-sensing system regulator BjaR1
VRADPASIAFAFIEAADRAVTVAEVVGLFRPAIERFGFRHFIVSGLPVAPRTLDAALLYEAWPPGWYDRYNERRYFEVDPVGQYALRTAEPFLWNEIRQDLKTSPASRMVIADARAHRLIDGYCVPIYGTGGVKSIVALATDRAVRLDGAERGALHLIGLTAHARLRALVGEEPPPEPRMTAREREILGWYAAGKSAWEIAAILDLSKRTVVAHLENVRAKFAVTTTVQAVVKAMRSGELSPL